MILEYQEKTRIKQVQVKLVDLLDVLIRVESDNGVGVFNTKTGKGKFMPSSKNLLLLTSKGKSMQLSPEFLETLKKEVESWKTSVGQSRGI